LYRVFSL
jgi:hypothetical protein